jgi:large conductance mechanosensitive channel
MAEQTHEHSPKTEREEKVAAHARSKALKQFRENSFVGKQATGFMTFIREQGVVSLAVGLAIGTAATVFVKSIVDNLITPAIGALMPGGGDLGSKYYCLTYNGTECVNKLGWGAVLNNFITFLAMAAVIYFVVKGLKLDKLDKKKDT